jgi:hypothetical protein
LHLSTEQRQNADTFFRITDRFHESYSCFPTLFPLSALFVFSSKESDSHILSLIHLFITILFSMRSAKSHASQKIKNGAPVDPGAPFLNCIQA